MLPYADSLLPDRDCLIVALGLRKATMKLKKETGIGRGGAAEGQGAPEGRVAPTGRHGRWYDDACGTAFALELIGERWALLIVRELMLGPRRFNDLRGALPAISAKVLTERLEGLERAGVLARRRLPPPVASRVYELTEWGYRAEEVILALGRW